jgi:hypothetical protein
LREFLRSAATGAAALATIPNIAPAQQGGGRGGRGGRSGAKAQPDDAANAREAGNVRPAPVSRVLEQPGSDYMVDEIKALGIEYVAANPGTSTGGLHGKEDVTLLRGGAFQFSVGAFSKWSTTIVSLGTLRVSSFRPAASIMALNESCTAS